MAIHLSRRARGLKLRPVVGDHGVHRRLEDAFGGLQHLLARGIQTEFEADHAEVFLPREFAQQGQKFGRRAEVQNQILSAWNFLIGQLGWIQIPQTVAMGNFVHGVIAHGGALNDGVIVEGGEFGAQLFAQILIGRELQILIRGGRHCALAPQMGHAPAQRLQQLRQLRARAARAVIGDKPNPVDGLARGARGDQNPGGRESTDGLTGRSQDS